MIIKFYAFCQHTGYIAGTTDGIVTVGGESAKRQICVFDVDTLTWLQTVTSNENGNYLIMGLDPNKRYLLMCRDLPPDGVNQRYEPFCWDYVTPMTDKTLAEQQEMWQQMTEK